MTYGLDEFRQDLKEVRRLLENQDYALINIIGNRIMSNAFILSGNSFAIAGLMIKDLALLIGPRKETSGSENLTSPATSSFKLFVKNLLELESVSANDSAKLWDIYLTTLKLTRKGLTSDEEYENYLEEKQSLTREGMLKLMEINRENVDLLAIGEGRMISSTVTEINRLYTAYGIDMMIAKMRLLYIILGLLTNYFSNKFFRTLVAESNDNIVRRFLSEILDLSHDNAETGSKLINDLLIRMINSWRELFIKFNEPFETREEEQKSGEPLPPELKEKLRDLITRNLEKDIKKAR